MASTQYGDKDFRRDGDPSCRGGSDAGDLSQRQLSLRKLVLQETGQDVNRCRNCASCNQGIPSNGQDLSLDSLVQMIIWNDPEVLTSYTLWSDEILQAVRYACQRGLDLRAIFLALRAEARKRKLINSSQDTET